MVQACIGCSGVLVLAVTLICTSVPAATAATTPPQPGTVTGSLANPHNLRPRSHSTPNAVIAGPVSNHGGPVQNAPRVYLDFWGWTSDPSGEQSYLTKFLSSIGGTPWLGTVNQYGGGSPAGLAGVWGDGSAIPASPSDTQIQQEAATAASHFGTGNSVNVDIVVATPTGHSTPGFNTNFCAYHGAVASDPNVTYTNLPYITDAGANCGEGLVNGSGGTLDGVSIVAGHELAEVITDPLLNAWFDTGGNEIGDKCAWTNLGNVTTSAGTFAVQPLWSNAANGCVRGGGGSTGAFEAAFEANTANLWTEGFDDHGDWSLGMMARTSPAIADLNWGLGMYGGTSPPSPDSRGTSELAAPRRWLRDASRVLEQRTRLASGF
jgi:serine protease